MDELQGAQFALLLCRVWEFRGLGAKNCVAPCKQRSTSLEVAVVKLSVLATAKCKAGTLGEHQFNSH